MAHIQPKNSNGEKVPSVTTVLGSIGWKTAPLNYWAWDLGMKGIDYRDVSRYACDIGTITHKAIDCELKNKPFDIDKTGIDEAGKVQVYRCIEGWHAWKEQTKLQVIASEECIVSEKYQFGGTFDCAAVIAISDKYSMIDFKTSKALYEDYLIQIRAYGELWNENKKPPIDDYHILRFSKDDGSFHHHRWEASQLDIAWDIFLHALALHNLHKTIKRMAA